MGAGQLTRSTNNEPAHVCGSRLITPHRFSSSHVTTTSRAATGQHRAAPFMSRQFRLFMSPLVVPTPDVPSRQASTVHVLPSPTNTDKPRLVWSLPYSSAPISTDTPTLAITDPFFSQPLRLFSPPLDCPLPVIPYRIDYSDSEQVGTIRRCPLPTARAGSPLDTAPRNPADKPKANERIGVRNDLPLYSRGETTSGGVKWSQLETS
jgi:hypothetical protein